MSVKKNDVIGLFPASGQHLQKVFLSFGLQHPHSGAKMFNLKILCLVKYAVKCAAQPLFLHCLGKMNHTFLMHSGTHKPLSVLMLVIVQ